jgi:hypothetical protein
MQGVVASERSECDNPYEIASATSRNDRAFTPNSDLPNFCYYLLERSVRACLEPYGSGLVSNEAEVSPGFFKETIPTACTEINLPLKVVA